MAQSKYFRYQAPRRQQYAQDDAGTRGLAAGVAAGKLISGLAGGFGEMQKNMVANKLMNTEDAPRAALVNVPGQAAATGGGPTAPDQGDTVDPSADLSTDLPEDVSTAVPSVQIPGDTSMPSGTGAGAPQGGDSGTTYGGTNTDPLASAVAAARLNTPAPAPTPGRISAADWAKQNPDVPVLGTPKHTGGVDEMGLQKEMLAMRLQKSQEGRATAEEARAAAKEADPIAKAQKLLELEKTRAEIAKANRPEKEDPNAPPVNIDSEPVRDTGQLSDYVDKQYGNNTYSGLIKAVSSSATGDELAPSTPVLNSDGTPKLNPDGSPAMEPAKSVTIPLSEANPLTGEAKKSVTLPLKDVQTFIRQTNLQRLIQGLPPLRVPGEDQTVGSTRDKPFVAHNQVEALSRAPGNWVLMPGETIPRQAWTVNGQPIRPTLPPRVKRRI